METLSHSDAARMLTRASAYEGALRQRTEGISLMVWGIVTSALFVTYGFASLLHAVDVAYALLWLPWVALGTVTTAALWRSAALSSPEPVFNRPSRWLLRVVLLSAGIGIVFAVLQPDGPNVPLAVTGAAWVLLGTVNLFRNSQRGRLLWAGAGLVLLAAGVVLQLVQAPIEVAGTVSIALPAAAAVTAGAWQTFSA